MLTVEAEGRRLPTGTEQRLQQFAELVAAGSANNRARARIQSLADQQAAWRQVAELAARDAPAGELLEAVAFRASVLASVDFATVVRYESDGSTAIVALSGAPEPMAIGMRAAGSGDGAIHRVWRTGRASRIEDLGKMSGHWPQMAHRSGYSASAAVPIMVQGAVWGSLVVLSRQRALSAAVVEHLTRFADLTGAAISATEARRERRSLADGQAALRRVAELVARGAALAEVFATVAAEASKLLGDLAAVLLCFDPDGMATSVAACNSPVPAGMRMPAGAGTATGDVLRTGRPVRVDSFAGTSLADTWGSSPTSPPRRSPTPRTGRSSPPPGLGSWPPLTKRAGACSVTCTTEPSNGSSRRSSP